MDKVQKILDLLKINEYFPDVNKDLILLAISNYVNNLTFLKKLNLLAKYGSYQTLEFYGDTMLDAIIVDYLLKNFGLNISAGDLTSLKGKLVKNDTLTSISIKTGVCQILTKSTNLAKHNICSDTFEAIIGALYYQYGYERMADISKWIFSLTELESLINQIWEEQILSSTTERQQSTFPSMVIDKKFTSDEDLFVYFLEQYKKKYKVEYEYEYTDEINSFIMRRNDVELNIFFFFEEEPNIQNILDGIESLVKYGILCFLPQLKYSQNATLEQFLKLYKNKYKYIKINYEGNRIILKNSLNGEEEDFFKKDMKKRLIDNKVWI